MLVLHFSTRCQCVSVSVLVLDALVPGVSVLVLPFSTMCQCVSVTF